MDLSLIVHTKNSSRTLPALLSSTTWIKDRIIVDMNSSDTTRSIAEAAGARIVTCPEAKRVDGIRNQYLQKSIHEWTLVLDSDEWLATGAEEEINNLLLQHGESFNAFAIPRYNYIGGRILMGQGWYPDPQIRLFRKGTVSWSDNVHECPTVLGGSDKIYSLKAPCPHIHHHNYSTISEVLERQLAYALSRNYDLNSFSFSKYTSQAYSQLGIRCPDGNSDRDMHKVLGLIMAWDSIIQGIIHWERMSVRPSLEFLPGLPVFVSAETVHPKTHTSHISSERERYLLGVIDEQSRELQSVRDGVLWKISNMLDRKLPWLKASLKRGIKALLG